MSPIRKEEKHDIAPLCNEGACNEGQSKNQEEEAGAAADSDQIQDASCRNNLKDYNDDDHERATDTKSSNDNNDNNNNNIEKKSKKDDNHDNGIPPPLPTVAEIIQKYLRESNTTDESIVKITDEQIYKLLFDIENHGGRVKANNNFVHVWNIRTYTYTAHQGSDLKRRMFQRHMDNIKRRKSKSYLRYLLKYKIQPSQATLIEADCDGMSSPQLEDNLYSHKNNQRKKQKMKHSNNYDNNNNNNNSKVNHDFIQVDDDNTTTKVCNKNNMNKTTTTTTTTTTPTSVVQVNDITKNKFLKGQKIIQVDVSYMVQ